MGEGELEVLGEELLDVGAADVLGVVDLDDLEDLYCDDGLDNEFGKTEPERMHTLMEPKRAR